MRAGSKGSVSGELDVPYIWSMVHRGAQASLNGSHDPVLGSTPWLSVALFVSMQNRVCDR